MELRLSFIFLHVCKHVAQPHCQGRARRGPGCRFLREKALWGHSADPLRGFRATAPCAERRELDGRSVSVPSQKLARVRAAASALAAGVPAVRCGK